MAQAEKTVRLQKVIARSGIASRRKAEELIQHGLVTVNGETVMTLGTKVDPDHDHIKVEGRHLKSRPPDMFLMLNKPLGYISTLHDPAGRPTIKALVPKPSIRLFPVGRLDYDSEGLLLLTNNGDIAQACLHPAHHVHKTYLVKIKGILEEPELQKLRHGLMLEDGPTAPAKVKKAGKAQANSWVEITIHEGRKHQVKRMFEQIGHPVIRLKRVQFGPLNLGTLPPGQTRYLTDKEANDLRHLLIAPDSPHVPTRQPVKSMGKFPTSRPSGQLRPRRATPNPIRSKSAPSPSGHTGPARPWLSTRQPVKRTEKFPKSGPAGQFWPRSSKPNPTRNKRTIATSGTTGQTRPRRPAVTAKTRFKFKP